MAGGAAYSTSGMEALSRALCRADGGKQGDDAGDKEINSGFQDIIPPGFPEDFGSLQGLKQKERKTANTRIIISN